MKLKGFVAAAMAMMISTAWAASPQEADALGKTLTPGGGEKAGNKDGSIPVWDGKEAPNAGWTHGKKRGDFWKFKDEKPLYSVDASNVDKYAEKLSPGQVQFIKQTKGYKMDVYPTHRNCSHPDFVQANTKKSATEAKIAANGWSLQHAVLPAVPFPIPKSGIEAVWNYMNRYRGVAVEWQDVIASVSPRPGNTDWIETHGPQTMYYPSGRKGSTSPAELNNIQLLYGFGYQSPPALAGQNMFWRYYFDKTSEIFYYFPGQRRVRRLPTYGYDAPQIGFENQYTMDELSMFSGDPDRFDWKIVGKKEMLIPYNSFGMYDFEAKMRDVYQQNYVNPAHRRYELHRVWVVEGKVKEGMRHSAPKKIFYLDEDSWLMAINEDYDAQGKLWKLREGFSIPVWEIGACDLAPFVAYDMINGRYVEDQTVVSTGKDIKWLAESNDKRYRDDYFSQENLRAISER